MEKVFEAIDALRKDSRSACEHMMLDMIKSEIPQWKPASEWKPGNRTNIEIVYIYLDDDGDPRTEMDNGYSFEVKDGKLVCGWRENTVEYFMILPAVPEIKKETKTDEEVA